MLTIVELRMVPGHIWSCNRYHSHYTRMGHGGAHQESKGNVEGNERNSTKARPGNSYDYQQTLATSATYEWSSRRP